jgi:hypothetical protein
MLALYNIRHCHFSSAGCQERLRWTCIDVDSPQHMSTAHKGLTIHGPPRSLKARLSHLALAILRDPNKVSHSGYPTNCSLTSLAYTGGSGHDNSSHFLGRTPDFDHKLPSAYSGYSGAQHSPSQTSQYPVSLIPAEPCAENCMKVETYSGRSVCEGDSLNEIYSKQVRFPEGMNEDDYRLYQLRQRILQSAGVKSSPHSSAGKFPAPSMSSQYSGEQWRTRAGSTSGEETLRMTSTGKATNC